MTNPFAKRWDGSGQAHTDTDAEIVQGKNMIDACKATSVQHFVLASVASAGEKTGVATFEAKWAVEEYGRDAKVPMTVIAPVGFFENMQSPFAGLKQGSVPGLIKQGKKAQMIACYDIGWFVANAFARPSEWIGRRFEVAGDTLSMEEQAETLARVRGEPRDSWSVSVPPGWVLKLFIPAAVGNLKKFLDDKGTHVDVKSCQAVHPELMNFEKWLVHSGIDKATLPSPGWCTIM